MGFFVLDFQYLCIVVTRIDLSPYMVDRDTKRSVTVVVDGGDTIIFGYGGGRGVGGGTSMMITPLKVLISVPDVLCSCLLMID